MKNKPLLIFRIAAVAISLFSTSYRMFIEPMHGHSLRGLFYQLGFFSVQSSLFITFMFVMLLINQLRGKEDAWPTPAFRGAALLYGILTSILFGCFFAQSFDLHGLNLVVLYINHIGLTLLIMVDNIVSVPPQTYKFDLLIYWMIYPLYYLIFTIYESLVLQINRYYFIVMDTPNQNFYPYVIFLMAMVFLLCAVIIIFINKVFRKKLDDDPFYIPEKKQ